MGKRQGAASTDEARPSVLLQSTGRHHALLQLLIAMGNVVVFAFWSAVVFATWPPPARCFVPGVDSQGSNVSYGHLLSNVSRYYLPVAGGERELCYYCPHDTNYTGQCTGDRARACDSGILYDVSESPTVDTLQKGFDMACGGRYKHDILMTLMPIGSLIGTFFTSLADRYGRRPVMLATNIGAIGALSLICIVENYYVYAACMVINMALTLNFFISVYSITTELVSEHGRALITVIEGPTVAAGCLYVGLINMLGVEHWRSIHAIVAVPMMINCAILFYVWPESISWLLTKGDLQTAMREARRMDHISGALLLDGDDEEGDPEQNELTPTGQLRAELERKIDEIRRARAESHSVGDDASLVGLFKTAAGAIVTLAMFLNWFTIGMLCYGLVEDTSELPGDPSANYVLSALAMLPVALTVYPAIRLAGRRGAMLLYFGVAGISLVVAAWLDRPQYAHLGWLVTVLAMVARSCSGGCFACVYVYTAELFPTVVRSTSFGACGLFARLGTIAAPQIEVLLTPLVGHWLTYATMGGVSLAAAIGTVLLPETRGRRPADTLAEFRHACGWTSRKLQVHPAAALHLERY